MHALCVLQVREVQTALRVGRSALEEGAFTKAKQALQKVGEAASQWTEVLLLRARAHYGLGEHIDAARGASTGFEPSCGAPCCC